MRIPVVTVEILSWGFVMALVMDFDGTDSTDVKGISKNDMLTETLSKDETSYLKYLVVNKTDGKQSLIKLDTMIKRTHNDNKRKFRSIKFNLNLFKILDISFRN